MEPYTIQNFMSSEAFTQLVIVVPESFENVVQYYVDNLEAAEWETYGVMQGAPPVMISLLGWLLLLSPLALVIFLTLSR